MHVIPKLVPISKLRLTQNEVLKQLSEGPVVLTQRGEAVAVLVDPEQWNRLVEELELWRDSYEVLEAKYRVATGEDEVIDWSEAEKELDAVPAQDHAICP